MNSKTGKEKSIYDLNHHMRVVKDFIEAFFDKTVFGGGNKHGPDYSPSFIKSLAAFTEESQEYRIGELGKNARVKSSTITDMVDRLEKDGFAERVSDSTDRRVVKVRLTPKGKKAKREFSLKMMSESQALFNKLQQEEAQRLVYHLEEACTILKKIS